MKLAVRSFVGSFRHSHLSSVLLPALLAGVVLGGCECTPEVARIAPQIYLDACKEPQRKVAGEYIGGFEKCGVDFGDTDISVKKVVEIKVTNPSQVELNLLDVTVVGDPGFKLELAPDEIGAGLSGFITVSVRPNAENEISGTLYVRSDANNTKQTENGDSLIEVPLNAKGVDNGVPDIQIDPTTCDFGRVAVGGVHVCPVAVKNVGNRGLVLDAVTFVPVSDEDDATLFQVPAESERSGGTDGVCDPTAEGCAFAFTGRPPSPDEEIAPEQSVVLSVRFTPDALGNYAGMFVVRSNDPDEAQTEIPVTLSGIGVTPPTCAIRVFSVNGVEVGDSIPEIEPLDDVVLTAVGSVPSSANGSIDRVEWSIGTRPVGSTVALSTPGELTTGFTFDNTRGVDLAGDYTVRAQVFDDLGTASVNECDVSFTAIPKDHFLVQLSWDTPTFDYDLHLTRQAQNGDYCVTNASSPVVGNTADSCSNGLDCNFATCQGGSRPEWDGLAGPTAGDPSLDKDDISGFGPENTNVDEMLPGRYLVSVDPFTGGPAGTTVRLYIFGIIRGEFYKDVEEEAFWEVAVVVWPTEEEFAAGVLPCVEDLTDGSATNQCG